MIELDTDLQTDKYAYIYMINMHIYIYVCKYL